MSGSWLRLSVFLAVLLSAQALVHAKWDLCTPGSHGILNLTAIEFGAPNPSRGVPWTMTVKGHLNASKPITNGKTKTEVWWGWFKVQSKTGLYCKENKCPVYPGPVVQSAAANLPLITPPGTYQVKTTSWNEDGELISCVKVAFSL
jgi:hypothetical protein